MLHRVCGVNFFPIDARFFESGIQQFPRRAGKRFALQIFLIARLFPDEQDFGFRPAFAEYRLRTAFPKVASFAILRGLP